MKNDWLFVYIIFGMIIILILWVGTVEKGIALGKKSLQIDAIEKGYGEWVVDKDGSAEFQWKADGIETNK